MSPKNKSASDDTTPAEAAIPPPAEAETVQVPTVTETSPSKRYSRGVVAAGVAGLLAAGGLAGFGIGRSTADDNGPEFARIGQFGPGGPGWGIPDGPRGNSDNDRRQDDRRFPPMPPGGPQDVQPDSQQDNQPSTDGSEGDTSGT